MTTTTVSEKKTVIIGASPNPYRYAFMAAERLFNHGVEFIPVGITKTGEVFGKNILSIKDHPQIEDVHTVTMYVSEGHFKSWEDYVIDLKPKRIIFNPGAENSTIHKLAEENDIEVVYGCTLVMLASGEF